MRRGMRRPREIAADPPGGSAAPRGDFAPPVATLPPWASGALAPRESRPAIRIGKPAGGTPAVARLPRVAPSALPQPRRWRRRISSGGLPLPPKPTAPPVQTAARRCLLLSRSRFQRLSVRMGHLQDPAPIRPGEIQNGPGWALLVSAALVVILMALDTHREPDNEPEGRVFARACLRSS